MYSDRDWKKKHEHGYPSPYEKMPWGGALLTLLWLFLALLGVLVVSAVIVGIQALLT